MNDLIIYNLTNKPMHHTYNEEKVKVSKWDLNMAIELRDKIHKKEITTKQAKTILNNELILI